MTKKKKTAWPVIENRKARHDYEILESITCGISLLGNEVKSLRAGSANLGAAWCCVENGQLILHNMHITKHETTNSFDADERRDRILLAHKSEIRKLSAKVQQDGITLVPLRLFWDRQYCKILLGVCRGKHTYDKRQALKERDQKREMERSAKI